MTLKVIFVYAFCWFSYVVAQLLFSQPKGTLLFINYIYMQLLIVCPFITALLFLSKPQTVYQLLVHTLSSLTHNSPSYNTAYICFPLKMSLCCGGGMPSFSSTRSFILSTYNNTIHDLVYNLLEKHKTVNKHKISVFLTRP